ncbi:hypothetical protein Barb7_02966 [Bacteroidales bacterium Barb7]|nr:hypothetical protein Barb7_02966 [Bacteroidales bacterium Barb7]
MDTSALGEHIFADNGFVRRNVYAGIGFNKAADAVNPILAQGRFRTRLIFEHGENAAERCIPRAFPQPVYCCMNPADTGADGGKHVPYRQIIVVMRMEIKADVRVMFRHLPTKGKCIVGIQNTQRVGQHKPLDRQVAQTVNECEHIIRRIFHPVRPVFKVNINRNFHSVSRFHHFADVSEMLFGRSPQLLGHMPIRTLAQ